jgi:hypothetical protein
VFVVTPHQIRNAEIPWSGLVFAFYVGDAPLGTASEWANAFLTGAARSRIEALLQQSSSRIREAAHSSARSVN